MPEWGQAGPFPLDPSQLAKLQGPCERLALGDKLRIVPGFDGLRVESTSYVGRLDVGPLRIAVNPKLEGAPLGRLLRYAYSLDELSMLPPDTALDLEAGGLQDLIVELLLAELEALWFSGLPKVYRRQHDELPFVRGRVRSEVFWRRGVLTGTSVPCEFHERTQDWFLNRVLRSGLDLARGLVTQPLQRRRIDRMIGWYDGVATLRPFGRPQVAEARASLTRMTSHTAPSLELIGLLLDGSGIGFEPTAAPLAGSSFLFDMNRFFQRLLSRFLHDHLPGHEVADESVLRGMYVAEGGVRPRRPPAPRPDFAVLAPGRQVLTYLDAKYRDLWARPLPADWLYQLTVYALASPSGSASILYATVASDARPEVIHVNDPASGRPLGRVLLKPVGLGPLSDLVADRSAEAAGHKQRLAAAWARG